MTITREQVERAAAHLADRTLSINFEDAEAFASMLRDLWQRVEELERELALKGSS